MMTLSSIAVQYQVLQLILIFNVHLLFARASGQEHNLTYIVNVI